MFTHNFDPVLIDLYIIEIRWYSLAYIVGILAGWVYAKKIIKQLKTNNNTINLEVKDFDDLIPYLVIGIILGGRLGYVLMYNFDYYLKNLNEILYIWNGGMSFHGGGIGVVVATIFYCNKKKINPLIYLDIISCVAPIGLFLGRIANFINGELYGKVTNLPWGIIFPNVGTLARHPSQIYEAVLEGLLLFLILNFLAFKKKLIFKNGLILVYFLFFYSIFRIFSETFREPDEQLGYLIYSLTMGQLLSLILFLVGVMIYSRIK
tara:strand:+ start:173 stop:961 length:789 start_codon:yes stop_codon:yes gene_type:complete